MSTVNKVVQVSTDGVNFINLAGSSGDLSIERSSNEFARFGSEFNASECGVMSWTLSGNSYYSGFCSYLTKIKKVVNGGGVAKTAITTANISGTTIYQTSVRADSVWDYASAVTVYDTDDTADPTDAGATTDVVPAASIDWIDYANGRVKLVSGYTVANGNIVVAATVLTLAEFAFANDWSISQSANTVETSSIATAQDNGGFRTYEAGLKQASLELSGFWSDSTHTSVLSHLTSSEVLYIEITPSGNETTESYVRGTFKLMSDSLSGEVGSDESESLSFMLYIPQSVSGYNVMPLGWVHPSATTLDDSVIACINTWENNGVLDMKYLPDGTNGHSGEILVTDVSVSGGLESLTEFSLSFQGTGALDDI